MLKEQLDVLVIEDDPDLCALMKSIPAEMQVLMSF